MSENKIEQRIRKTKVKNKYTSPGKLNIKAEYIRKRNEEIDEESPLVPLPGKVNFNTEVAATFQLRFIIFKQSRIETKINYDARKKVVEDLAETF